jgi:hypothetical protein
MAIVEGTPWRGRGRKRLAIAVVVSAMMIVMIIRS